MTSERRAQIVATLEDSERRFREAAGDVPADKQGFKPDPERWSPLEIVEHVGMAEAGMFRMLNAATPSERREDPAREQQLMSTLVGRAKPAPAPDRSKPIGRFDTLADALEAFGAARRKTIQYAAETELDLFAVAAQHPLFGNVNGYELLTIMAGHPLRHAAQIRETVAG